MMLLFYVIVIVEVIYALYFDNPAVFFLCNFFASTIPFNNGLDIDDAWTSCFVDLLFTYGIKSRTSSIYPNPLQPKPGIRGFTSSFC